MTTNIQKQYENLVELNQRIKEDYLQLKAEGLFNLNIVNQSKIVYNLPSLTVSSDDTYKLSPLVVSERYNLNNEKYYEFITRKLITVATHSFYHKGGMIPEIMSLFIPIKKELAKLEVDYFIGTNFTVQIPGLNDEYLLPTDGGVEMRGYCYVVPVTLK
jgi:hypothetical protein